MSVLFIPYGLDDTGRLPHVDDVERGKACGLHCPSCESPLKANKGTVRRHHLAHLPGFPACEGWLHATAKLLLYQRIADAMDAGIPLPVRWCCKADSRDDWSIMSHINDADLLGKGIIDGIFLERYLPGRNVKPDIVCMTGDTPKVLIEIVDTHAPEPPVITVGMPVLEVHITDATGLDALAEGPILVAQMHNYPCAECCRLKEERQEAERRQQEGKRQMLEGLKGAGMEYRTGNLLPITPVKQDKYGAYLRRDTQAIVNGAARNLQRMGFQQRSSRPTLFSLTCRTPYGDLHIFADLDSTDTIRLWDFLKWGHTIPAALFAFPKNHRLRECALEVVGDELDQWGIANRRHFPDIMGLD